MKTKLTELAKTLNIEWDEALKLRDTKLETSEWTGKGKNTWLTPQAATKIELAADIPPAVPDVLYARHVRNCNNPQWIRAKIEGFTGNPSTYDILIPRRLYGKLEGKRFPIHAITDEKGTTYRYAKLTGRYN